MTTEFLAFSEIMDLTITVEVGFVVGMMATITPARRDLYNLAGFVPVEHAHRFGILNRFCTGFWMRTGS
ncbi:MAG: hypothetical protein ACLUI3_17280 [Christensenellales bacterium]